MAQPDVHLPQRRAGIGFLKTARHDAWYVQPGLVLLGLLTFVVYSTWAAFVGTNYHYAGGGADYLSPFYSPLLFDAAGQPPSGVSWFGAWPSWWPAFIPATPALLILWAPGGFRFTCYYYRGAYYKSFWGAPPACAVGGPHTKRYRGERRFPLILQNVHRYFLYLALLFLLILAHDAWKAMWFETPEGAKTFGFGLGTIVLIVNPILLGGYTLGCHSLRHLVGGKKDCISANGARKTAYDCVSCLNRAHMRWAWASLFWVGFTDLYVRLCASGVIHDVRLF
ncbi:MAG: hypothetical protein R3B57_06335 [Phycisphaerales bacterium]